MSADVFSSCELLIALWTLVLGLWFQGWLVAIVSLEMGVELLFGLKEFITDQTVETVTFLRHVLGLVEQEGGPEGRKKDNA